MSQDTLRIVLVLAFAASLSLVISTIEFGDHDDESSLPCMYIDIPGKEAVSKDAYVSCRITVDSEDCSLSDADAGIKGRGNSTWGLPKKPYNIKFDKKTDLFEIGSAKTWVLLANYLDKSMVRNFLSYTVAEALGSEYTTATQFVNLFINGEYQGLYLLTEKIQIGEERVDIAESDDEDNNFSFIVEMDSHAFKDGAEGVDYFSVNGRDYSIKDPDCTPEQVGMVKAFMEEAWDAIGSGDWRRVDGILNVDSFVSTYIVEELFHDADVDLTSFYLFRGPDEKLHSGPIWDFDLCAGNYNATRANDPDRLYAAEKSIWYSSLLRYDEFRGMVSDKLSESKTMITQALDRGLQYLDMNEGDFVRNFERWPILDRHVTMNPFTLMLLDTWQEHVDYTVSWLNRSLDTLLREYCQEREPRSARVTFRRDYIGLGSSPGDEEVLRHQDAGRHRRVPEGKQMLRRARREHNQSEL